MATQVKRAIRQAGLHIPNLEETGRNLGEGSYGEVVEVRVRGKRYAGKKLHKIFYERDVPPADTAAIAQRFEEECRRVPHLKHRNIVQMIGVHFHPRTRQPTLVMELMDTSLTRYLEEHASVPPTVKHSILLGVASGLVYLHTLSPPVGPIVHRDLTANNVLLNLGEEIIAKIADLGQARIVGRNPVQMARLTKCPGNVDHMPPEAQIDDPVYGTALDIFSFGVVMLHTLAHVWPKPLAKLDSAFQVRSEVERRKTYLDKIEGSLLKPLVVECLGDSAESRPAADELTGALKFAIKLHPQIQSMVVSHEEVLHQVHDLGKQLEQQHQQHKQLLEQRMSQHMKEKDLQQQVHQAQQQLLKTEQELKLQNQQQHQQHQKKLEEIMSQHMQEKQLLQQQLHQAKQELLETEQELKLQNQQLQQQHQQHKQRLEQSVCQHKKEKDLLQEQCHQAQQQFLKTEQELKLQHQQLQQQHQQHRERLEQSISQHVKEKGLLQEQLQAQQAQEQQHKQRLEQNLYQQKEFLQQQLQREQQQLWKTEHELIGLKLRSQQQLAQRCSLNGVEPVQSTTGWEQTTSSISYSSTTSPSIPACPLETGSDYSVFVSISFSPTHLCCQVMDQDGMFDQLMQQISEYCEADQPAMEVQRWMNGDVVLAQFSEDQAWYRARITNIASTGTSADVLFVDYGNSEHATTMRPITEEFCSLPAQAILCQLEGVEQYRVLDETGFNELVTAEESGFNMRVVSMGPEKVGVALSLVSDGRGVLEYVVERGVLAKREPDEMEGGGEGGEEEGGGEVRGEEAWEGEVERVESGLQPMPVEAGSKEEVFVSHLESPTSFWLQMAFTETDLTALGEQLETVYSNPNERKKLTLLDPKPGQACCAQFSQDQQWYRSIVESVDSSGVKVHFVDWGNSEMVPPANILLLKQEFLELPSQAIHCQLAEAFPVGPGWSDWSITCFSNLVMEKPLSAQFVGESSGMWSVRLVSQDENIATAMM